MPSADTVNALKAYIANVHEEGLKAKIYYTVRELTNHIVELWALRSLGHEVFPQIVFHNFPSYQIWML